MYRFKKKVKKLENNALNSYSHTMHKLKDIYKNDSSYKAFLLSLLCVGVSYGLYKGILDNYLAQVVKMGEFDRGVTEFFRELPGFLLIFILAFLVEVSVENTYKLGAFIMLIGLALIAVLPPSKVLVIIAICVYSTGEHIQLGMKNTLSINYANKGCGGISMGIQNAISNFGNIGGYIIVAIIFALLSNITAFKTIFITSLIILLLSCVINQALKSDGKARKNSSRFYFRKKFNKYYMLEIFYGARKQIFFTFGPYVLILFYKADASVISMLFAISAICCFFLSPIVGKLIDKIGYKIVMVSDTLILIVVCFFYGFAHHFLPMNIAFIVCCINYLLDSVISLASMASNVYVQDISDNEEEVRATITTGISVNHLISILIALFGGWIWQVTGIETLFSLSAILGLINSIYAATIKTSKAR